MTTPDLQHLEYAATYIARLTATLKQDQNTVELYNEQFSMGSLLSGGLNTLIQLNSDIFNGCISAIATSIASTIPMLESYRAARECLELLHSTLVVMNDHSCTPQQCRNISDMQLSIEAHGASLLTLSSVDLLVVANYANVLQRHTDTSLTDALANLRQTAIERQSWQN